MSLAQLKKGDLVKVLVGKDRGKTGLIERVMPRQGRLIVSGINLVKKHLRPQPRYRTGGITSQPAAVNLANVALICPHCQRPTKISRPLMTDRRQRTCKKCHQLIDHYDSP